jgi:cyclic pyranopterin phosphate synthase
MVDVSAKQATVRQATAVATVSTRADVVALIVDGGLPKGEAVATARIAGILAAKRTPDLIPLCHPLPLTGVDVDVEPHGEVVDIRATVRTTAVTGVEMEALTAATIAALTMFDMIKAVDKQAVITDVCVVAKSGGKSGNWQRDKGKGKP